MPKLVALISALPDISRADFIAHYESSHAPLILELLPSIGRYTRSFLSEEDREGGGGRFDYDVVTELWFDDQAALDAFYERLQQPEVIARIREDERHFLQSDRTRMFAVDETGG